MSDLFDNDVPLAWFDEAWTTIEECGRVDIQVVTKRVSNVEKRLAAIGRTAWQKHAGLIITVVNQEEADRDVPRLLALKERLGIPWVGLSIEPMLGPIDLTRIAVAGGWYDALSGWRNVKERFAGIGYLLDWVIVGGESGPDARLMHLDCPRAIRDQCAAAGVPFFFKQWGEWLPIDSGHPGLRGPGFGRFDHCPVNEAGNATHVRAGKKAAGHLLDGVEHHEFPKWIAA